jgi:hypothetical protein
MAPLSADWYLRRADRALGLIGRWIACGDPLNLRTLSTRLGYPAFCKENDCCFSEIVV